ncbi:hypothetical protein ARMSODRAFT_432907 [Armillaria solidipes]|uniref:Uncharacterized protein n=1 Tax=Armillaria solidipes TaxID=1076256 RepID=A0A2H3B497_9AGAR|nr:hypothetical protein ARMSODRAFT_432907 [Armillaria solidipes]
MRVSISRSSRQALSRSTTIVNRKEAEEARVQCRELHQTSVKRGKYTKRSLELGVVRTLISFLSVWKSQAQQARCGG